MRKITVEDFTRINNDGNGNPRYIVDAWLMPRTWRELRANFKIYRAKKVTSHLVICTYDLTSEVADINEMLVGGV